MTEISVTFLQCVCPRMTEISVIDKCFIKRSVNASSHHKLTKIDPWMSVRKTRSPLSHCRTRQVAPGTRHARGVHNDSSDGSQRESAAGAAAGAEHCLVGGY